MDVDGNDEELFEVQTQYQRQQNLTVRLTSHSYVKQPISGPQTLPPPSQSLEVSFVTANANTSQVQASTSPTQTNLELNISSTFPLKVSCHDNVSSSKCDLKIHHPSTEPPSHETMVPIVPVLIFDSTKLKPIDFSVPMPVSTISFGHSSHCPSSEFYPSHGLKSRSLVAGSHIKNQMRLARRNALTNLGLLEFNEKRKLFTAVRNGDVEEVSTLLHNCVHANASDNKRRTALHIASSLGLEHIVSLLISARADPNRQDILGNTPLHLGANIHLKDNLGQTPLCIVRSRLSTLRKDKSISTDKLINECQMISSILKVHCKAESAGEIPVDTLCNMMEAVSTREQADQIADLMINQMSDLCIDKEKVDKSCTKPFFGHSIL
ncbi:uncharacterized protein LOC131941548 isoform X2 [Physella acuta]|uniref:uncharacterized protein LOC131941548 isoform X2 n=1 Tax=Physella acuta TaxID=109671 RepID=UPI0027DAED59|nr:uncharacterized protein LOC131941548 isoform X2 [Physella acuta]